MNILLLTDIPPCSNYTAGLVQAQLCRFLHQNGHKISLACVMDDQLRPEFVQDITFEREIYLRKPPENYGQVSNITSLVGNGYHRLITCNALVKKITENFSDLKIDIIWSVVQGQTMISIVRPVAKRLGVKYSVQIWDPPEWWLQANKFDDISQRAVLKEFSELLRDSYFCMAASHAMAEEYSRLFHCRAIPVMPSLPRNDHLKAKRDESKFKILFTGQVYCPAELELFLSAIDKLGWAVSDIPIYFDAFTPARSSSVWQKYPLARVYSWVDQPQLLAKVSDYDLCYCPYRFDKGFELIARLSFPSKLTSYLYGKVPAFIHAPEYASIVKFVTDKENGYVCCSLDVDVIAKKLRQTILSSDRGVVGLNGYNLFENSLTLETMEKNFFVSLGIQK